VELVEESPKLTPGGNARELAVVDTAELRWFATGQLPPDIRSWFTCDGATGSVGRRIDTYRLDGRRDIGVKLRFRETLEVKVRQSVGANLALGAGLEGRVEVWRKWSPAGRLLDADDSGRWVDVHKTVIKRRFSAGGDELVIAPGGAHPVDGCDVEIAAIDVEGVAAWTFAFAAYGPAAGRQYALVASWQGLEGVLDDGRKLPEQLDRLLDRASGYPEWLAALRLAADPRRPIDDRVVVPLTAGS